MKKMKRDNHIRVSDLQFKERRMTKSINPAEELAGQFYVH